MTLDRQLVVKLREMKETGVEASKMLEKIQLIHSDELQISLLCMKYLREAFNLSIPGVSPNCGWRGFGGELTDEQINGLVTLENNTRE
jgi:hypothetical protein